MTRPKILLAEGTDDIRNAMRESLKDESCDVISSGTIAHSLSQILAQQFDVVITDLHTRRSGDHRMLAAALRTFQPVCLLVAVSDSLTIEQAAMAILLEADYIIKPSNIKEVLELVYEKAEGVNPPSFSGAQVTAVVSAPPEMSMYQAGLLLPMGSGCKNANRSHPHGPAPAELREILLREPSVRFGDGRRKFGSSFVRPLLPTKTTIALFAIALVLIPLYQLM